MEATTIRNAGIAAGLSESLSTVLMKAPPLSALVHFVFMFCGDGFKSIAGLRPRAKTIIRSGLRSGYSTLTDHLGDLGDLRDLRSRVDIRQCVRVCVCACVCSSLQIFCALCKTVGSNCAAHCAATSCGYLLI